MIVSIVVLTAFVITYYFMLNEKYKTSVMAMLVALSLAATGMVSEISIENLPKIIDFNTLGLLVGMMIMVGLLKRTGFFHFVSVYAIRAGKGDLKKTLILIVLSVALLSAFLDNVTTLLVFAPILFSISDVAGLDPTQLITMGILSSNIGGVSTLIGDPPNILIGSASKLSFLSFMSHLAPIAVVVLILMLVRTVRNTQESEEIKQNLRKFASVDPKSVITDPKKMKYIVTVFALVIFCFSIHTIVKVELSLVAMLGAVITLAITGEDFEEAAKEIEWNTIFFLIGLFILTYSLKQVGLTDAVAKALIRLTYPPIILSMLIWLAGFGAMFLGAVPATTIMIPIVKSMINSGLPTTTWWALALGVGLGANGSPIGAAANMVGLGLLKKFSGKTISFPTFFKKNISFTLISLTIATCYILLMLLVGW